MKRVVSGFKIGGLLRRMVLYQILVCHHYIKSCCHIFQVFLELCWGWPCFFQPNTSPTMKLTSTMGAPPKFLSPNLGPKQINTSKHRAADSHKFCKHTQMDSPTLSHQSKSANLVNAKMFSWHPNSLHSYLNLFWTFEPFWFGWPQGICTLQPPGWVLVQFLATTVASIKNAPTTRCTIKISMQITFFVVQRRKID